MVRLKELLQIKVTDHIIMFQFHNGSIKSLHPWRDGNSPGEFQFHNGSIKSFLSLSVEEQEY